MAITEFETTYLDIPLPADFFPSWIPGRSDRDNWRRAAAALAQIGTPAAIEVLETFARSRRPELSRICHEFLKVAQRERP